jgi:hypothetical protein
VKIRSPLDAYRWSDPDYFGTVKLTAVSPLSGSRASFAEVRA